MNRLTKFSLKPRGLNLGAPSKIYHNWAHKFIHPTILLRDKKSPQDIFNWIHKPISKEALQKWIEAEAFCDLLDTGDPKIEFILQKSADNSKDHQLLFYYYLCFWRTARTNFETTLEEVRLLIAEVLRGIEIEAPTILGLLYRSLVTTAEEYYNLTGTRPTTLDARRTSRRADLWFAAGCNETYGLLEIETHMELFTVAYCLTNVLRDAPSLYNYAWTQTRHRGKSHLVEDEAHYEVFDRILKTERQMIKELSLWLTQSEKPSV